MIIGGQARSDAFFCDVVGTLRPYRARRLAKLSHVGTRLLERPGFELGQCIDSVTRGRVEPMTHHLSLSGRIRSDRLIERAVAIEKSSNYPFGRSP
jgi:hypothetical protein